MSKSAIQNQIKYIIANEQYLKPLLERGAINEEVYSKTLGGLYECYEIWRSRKIHNPSIEYNRKKREPKFNLKEQNPEYVSLTDMSRKYTDKAPGYVIQSWMRDNNTINFLTVWEKKHNDKFVELAELEDITVTPKIWITKTGAKGILSRQGKNGGTYAHKEIAMHFMCWLSADMMLQIIEKYLEDNSNEKNN
ncbi:MAG: KilA-N domain-containing protein [Clostridia bacterium]|nr:KilA-N domain-containing protein [Clostridia bacterium]